MPTISMLYGIIVRNAFGDWASVTLRNNTFRDASKHGAFLDLVGVVNLSNNRFMNNALSGVWLAGSLSAIKTRYICEL